MLRLLPRRYDDRRSLTPVAGLADGSFATLAARVVSAGPAFSARRRRMFRAVLADDTGRVTALWFRFRAAHLGALLQPGARLIVHGRVARAAGRTLLLQPELEPAAEDGGRAAPPLRPVYPATEGLSQGVLRSIVRAALEAALPALEDPLGEPLRARLGLPGLAEALRAIHAPEDRAGGEGPPPDPDRDREQARRRLVFDELLGLQLRFAARRAPPRRPERRLVRLPGADELPGLAAGLPFALTAAQRRACADIFGDLAGPRPMQRLLQGDVGSGKTVVAALAIRAVVGAGGQAALLVPTELLAEQHFLTLAALAGRIGLAPQLLTRSVPREPRERVLAGLADGSVSLVVGTHALLGEAVRFARLALAVVDEQHRFGVRQRLALRQKGDAPDLLVMTATPIPRSLALALYGDLDLSVIDELPPGRRAVRTAVVGEDARRESWELLRAELAAGRRAYVVCPRVDGGDDEEALAAVRAAERLRRRIPGVQVGLAHGGMPLEQRVSAMERFRRGEAPVLVATTVVEVGLDVPEASVIVVEQAERFGLSQLHQLRGRVGRGPHQAHCLLHTGPRPSPEALERLAVLARTADGFEVAEADLALRGPGQFLGTRQSGAGGLLLAGVARDADLLAAAQREARRIVDADPRLALPAHRALRGLVARGESGPGAAGAAG